MENKYLKYGLIAGAVFVWGAIIVRVFGGLSRPTPPPWQAPRQQVIAAQPASDSFVLFADYPDPFLPDPDSITDIAAKSTSPYPSPAGTPALPPPPPLKSMIQYIGLIANPQKKVKIAILNINGKEVLLREKGKKDGLLLIKIERDKVIVDYNGRHGEIEKND